MLGNIYKLLCKCIIYKSHHILLNLLLLLWAWNPLAISLWKVSFQFYFVFQPCNEWQIGHLIFRDILDFLLLNFMYLFIPEKLFNFHPKHLWFAIKLHWSEYFTYSENEQNYNILHTLRILQSWLLFSEFPKVQM